MSSDEDDMQMGMDEDDEEMGDGGFDLGRSSSSGRDHDKRIQHNALERKRRNSIKGSFQLLKQAIPVDKNEKLSRVQILQKAAEYIGKLEVSTSSNSDAVEELRLQNNYLERQIAALEQAKASGSPSSSAEVLWEKGLHQDASQISAATSGPASAAASVVGRFRRPPAGSGGRGGSLSSSSVNSSSSIVLMTANNGAVAAASSRGSPASPGSLDYSPSDSDSNNAAAGECDPSEQ